MNTPKFYDSKITTTNRIAYLRDQMERIQDSLAEVQVAEDHGCNMGNAVSCLTVALRDVDEELAFIV